MTLFLLFVLIFLLFILRQPAFVVLGVAVGYVYLFYGSGVLVDIAQDMFTALDQDILLAVPLFICAGSLMGQGTIAVRLIDVAKQLTGFVNGGLGVAGILSCALFAAISGSSVVTLLAIGSVLYPALVREGYPRKTALGILSSSGTLGVIVPPSIPLILYGLVTQTSVLDLFLAGVLPALLITAAMVVWVLYKCRNMPRTRWNTSELVLSLRRGTFAILMPVIILGGIYSGIFTATEAAGIAVLYALLVEGLVYRELSFALLRSVVKETVVLMGVVFPILALAVSLNQFLAYENIPQMFAAALMDFTETKATFLALVIVILLITGCVMDMTPAILLLAPLLTPIAMTMGVDPIHFGIIMVVSLEIGYLTPPMGLNLFVASSSFNEDFSTVVKGSFPFVCVMFLTLVLITFIPEISLLLVSGG
ncbi:TRAP transporter large permease [Sneathiella chinensis]|uniref:TRAP transporter large permease protein n=1 Tax=Sneathiella chinensis TaxID=349750 RepID=A0ABQ5U3P9_9PROT|nr:TRAP transporter large permease [Sneathiella chinensis]GLQ06780.1 C4-dicarboxylate TRAP transporter large permease protein DctM [Sneathiella chinensis]